jgi:hypothetical protein
MSAEGDIRARIKTVIETEFTTEGWTVTDDKLGRSTGMDGQTHVATSPIRSYEDRRRVIQLNIEVLLQVFLPYEVDPSVIEGYGDRIRAAFGPNSSGNTGDMWGFRVTEISYPDDPTGNKTRLEAQILGYANNEAALSG